MGCCGLERSVSGVVAWLNTISCFDRFAVKTIWMKFEGNVSSLKEKTIGMICL